MTKRDHEPGIHVDLARGSTYGDYLCLEQILTAQKPRSAVGQHDEMLFIIQHQTSELWMRLMIHELDEAIANVKDDKLEPCFKILARVGQIQRMLFEQWSVLETMTPNEYLTFRPALGPASGFQSFQYRAIEFALGNKDAKSLAPHKNNPAVYADLQARLERPSLYDEFLRWLGRHGHAIPKDHLERDFTLPYEASPEIVAVFKRIYEDTSRYWSEYDMCEKLIDVEERFQLWRFRHVTTVKRVIGFKRGTGGSSGVPFLEKALLTVFFPELWDVRTALESPARET